MYCQQCGAEAAAGDQRCTDCGADLEARWPYTVRFALPSGFVTITFRWDMPVLRSASRQALAEFLSEAVGMTADWHAPGYAQFLDSAEMVQGEWEVRVPAPVIPRCLHDRELGPRRTEG